MFQRATKRQSKLRLALIGPSGSGKTYTSLLVAKELAGETGAVAVIDTERGSASKYADEFAFDVCELPTFAPDTYVEAIEAAEAAGYAVIVIDSLTHAWSGKEGALEQVDKAAARSQSRNSYTAWRDVTPMHNRLIDAMIGSSCHVIATMRSKTEYVMEEDDRGKKVPRKIGMAPVQRDGMEYEFDVVGEMTIENRLVISKSRCRAVAGQVIDKPGHRFAETLRAWLTDGAPDGAQIRAELAQSVAKWADIPLAEKADMKAAMSQVKRACGVTSEHATDAEVALMHERVLAAVAAGTGFAAFVAPPATAPAAPAPLPNPAPTAPESPEPVTVGATETETEDAAESMFDGNGKPPRRGRKL